MLASTTTKGNGKYAHSYALTEQDKEAIIAQGFSDKLLGLTAGTHQRVEKEDLDSSIECPEPQPGIKATIITNLNIPTASPEPSGRFILIIRHHYIPLILQSLRDVQPHAKTANITVYIDEILHSIVEYETRSPDDPLLEVFMALYDALSADSQCSDYSSDQYNLIGDVISVLMDKYPISPEEIEKAIIKLEDIGLDTTPYSIDD